MYFYRRRRAAVRRRKSASHAEYGIYKHMARMVIMSRLEHFAAEYARLDPAFAEAMRYRRVSVRNQRSRWGSCSAGKNLNFNYRLMHLPSELRDYVIVHELCHLVELNHSPRFWSLLERMIPNARALGHQVRRMHIAP